MDLRKLITDYLEQARLMQVATAKNNQPWASTVLFAFDENFNLYWISKPDTRHSQEIGENEKIAGTIVSPTALGENVRGLQFEGIAREATGEDMKKAIDVYAARVNMKDERKQKLLDKTDGHNAYIITPKLFVLFDTLNFPDNPRQEYKI
jgi:uncharacterized protein YhbP (UPF0306 family)